MSELLTKVFGNVLMNKVRLAIGDSKRHAVTSIAKLFVEGYVANFKKAGFYWKAYFLVAPFLNLFLFGSLLGFLLAIASDVYLIRKAMDN